MVHLSALTLVSTLAYVMGVSASPAGGNGNKNSTIPAGAVVPDITPEDILNAPVVVPPLDDPSFAPIDAGSNATIIKILPTFASIVTNLPSITASIASSLATATPTGTLPPGAPKNRRENSLTKRKQPPNPLVIDDIDCNFEFNPKIVKWNLWKAAITSACQTWFDDAAHTSPLLYLLEGSHQGPMGVGPPSFLFHFSYKVRDNPFQPFNNWHPYSSSKCIAELEARMFAALNPDATGIAQSSGLCLGDWSGWDSNFDANAPIWFTLESPK